MEAIIEKSLQEFEDKRNALCEHLSKAREEMKMKVDKLFEQIELHLQPSVEETDNAIEDYIKEFKKLSVRKRELQNNLDKLTPLLELIQIK